MLRFLGVRHLAVIEALEAEFEPGLNLITGETGAGKSVLVEAIELLLGGRASADLVRTGESSATVQAVFERADGRDVLVRREISAEGRSRAFLDDALATTGALREVGRPLVELHGQHEHQTLLDPAAHGALLDAFIGEPELFAALERAFESWRAASTDLGRSQLDEREKRARIEIATYHAQEIDKVAPEAGEDDRLDAERQVLANADRLDRLSREAYNALYDHEHSALTVLGTVWKRVSDLAAIDERWREHLDARDTIKPALEELAYALREYASRIDAAPERLQAVEDRRAAIERLKRKYGPELADVLARRQTLAAELAALEASEERIAALEETERRAQAAFVELAERASQIRTRAADRLGRALAASLVELAIPQAVVDVRLSRIDRSGEWTSRGFDRAEIFFSANPGEDVRPLARIASGGELSRVMLALHTLADTGPGRTLVFDEVDAGIGGAAADAVGARLSTLAERHQVICITHLAQVAARPATHFQISKLLRGGRTTTLLTKLDRAGRELELARMIAGVEITPRVLASAREMLDTRGESEYTAKGETPQRAKAKGRVRGA
jgi:DNA repair protein RecN (Recombination protein N)